MRELKGDEHPQLISNLKSISLFVLLQRTGFAVEAPVEEKLFYARDIILDEPKAGNIGDVASLIHAIDLEASTKEHRSEILTLAAEALKKYIENYGEGRSTSLQEYKERYADDIAYLESLQR